MGRTEEKVTPLFRRICNPPNIIRLSKHTLIRIINPETKDRRITNPLERKLKDSVKLCALCGE